MTVVDLPPVGARDPVLPPDEIAAAGLDKASSGNPAPERTQVRQPPPQVLPVESNDNRETVEEIKVYAPGTGAFRGRVRRRRDTEKRIPALSLHPIATASTTSATAANFAT